MANKSQLTLSSHVPPSEQTHNERLEDWRKRLTQFTEQTTKLATYLMMIRAGNFNDYNGGVIVDLTKVDDTSKQFQDYECNLTDLVEECGTLTRSANVYCHERRAIYRGRTAFCRVYINLSAASFDIIRTVQIQYYFSSNYSSLFLKLYRLLRQDQTLYVFHYRFPASNLWHKVCASQDESLKLTEIKRWTVQLAKAAELMNLTGVAHRFLRPENILLTSDGVIKVAAFEMACLYWNAMDRQTVMIPKQGLPSEVPLELWDHLPPECFQPKYDATMVDSWSIGVVLCSLLLATHPFDPTKPQELLKQWKQCSQRTQIPEEIRSLLDDVFQPAQYRITVYDMSKDSRLYSGMSSTRAVASTTPYYRIDQVRILLFISSLYLFIYYRIQLNQKNFKKNNKYHWYHRSHHQMIIVIHVYKHFN